MSIYEAVFLTSVVVACSGAMLVFFADELAPRVALVGVSLSALAVVSWPIQVIVAIWRNAGAA